MPLSLISRAVADLGPAAALRVAGQTVKKNDKAYKGFSNKSLISFLRISDPV